MASIHQKISLKLEKLSKIDNEIFENRSFDDLCSLKVEENARFYCELEDYDQLNEIDSFLREKSIKHLVLGEGTNIVPINNFEGLVIKNKLKGITEIDESFVEVSSGENWNEFVKWSLFRRKEGFRKFSINTWNSWSGTYSKYRGLWIRNF